MQLWINSEPNRWLCPPVFFGYHYVNDPWGIPARMLTQSPGLPQSVTITALKASRLGIGSIENEHFSSAQDTLCIYLTT